MSHISGQARRNSPLQPLLMWGLCALAFGLLAWRCLSIYSAPLTLDSQHPLSELVAAIVGPGNAQISETANGNLLILLNGPAGAIDPVVATQLTDIVQAASIHETGPVLKQFPFATKAGFNPTETELTELAGLGLLASLALMLAFASRSQASAMPAPDHAHTPAKLPQSYMSEFADIFSDASSPPPFDVGPQLAPVELMDAEASPHALADAQRFAQANPDVTAKVIETWIRARGFKK